MFKLKAYVEAHRSLAGYGSSSKNSAKNPPPRLSKQEFFQIKCDLVIPAALQLQLGREEAANLDPSVVCVVEAANGPVSAEAERVLEERGVEVIPDVLANSGGVVVSYYEWIQNKQDWVWGEEHVRGKLNEKMVETFRKIHNLAKMEACSLRTACYIYALRRLEKVYMRRGVC